MNTQRDAKGAIFNIQSYSIHDGPGIRTTVFLKGCPLTCLWCQNPESNIEQPQIFFIRERCIGCGRCELSCPSQAIRIHEGKAKTDRKRCTGCGSCESVCSDEARSLVGEYITAEYVLNKVMQDNMFYDESGGGVTLSGGEPLAQPQFAAAVLELCKNEGINTAIETSGFSSWQTLQLVLQHVDLVLYDLKHMHSEEHRRLTGVSNKVILDNIKKVYHELSIPIVVRIPVIPGCNDSIANVNATAKFISTQLGKEIMVHLLPFHLLGESKRERLEFARTSFHCATPSDGHMSDLQKIYESYGLTAQIGG